MEAQSRKTNDDSCSETSSLSAESSLLLEGRARSTLHLCRSHLLLHFVEDLVENNFITFDENHYKAMLFDEARTALYVKAIEQRLAKHPRGTMTVLDIGTGPFCVLAFAAARAGYGGREG